MNWGERNQLETGVERGFNPQTEAYTPCKSALARQGGVS